MTVKENNKEPVIKRYALSKEEIQKLFDNIENK